MYRSPFGRVVSIAANLIANLHKPFMVYGYCDRPSGRFRKFTRMSSTVAIMNRDALSVGDHVWVGHYTILDATEGLTIGEGTQIAANAALFTHGSQTAIRLLGRRYVHIHNTERKGYTRGRIEIGEYTFIGAGSTVLPGVRIGKGCLIGTGALVNRDVPDCSVIVGRPGRVVGSTIDIDKQYLAKEDFSDTYYDQCVLGRIMTELDRRKED
jgi:acetyltransferase-like isoleucine patch superfamily enzyme